MPAINEHAIPIYLQVAQTIRRRITEGIYRPGDLIPPAKKLEKDFEVSDITIRKALDILVREKIVARRRGIGTSVTQRGQYGTSFNVSGNFRELLDAASGKPIQFEVNVLDIVITSTYPNQVREILSLGHDEDIWRMKRIRKRNGIPISYFINYGRPELFSPIKKKEIQKRSFVELATERYGIRFEKVEQLVEATIADMDLSVLLSTKFGDPLFYVTNTYFSNSDEPVAVTHMYFRGDQYRYHATLKL